MACKTFSSIALGLVLSVACDPELPPETGECAVAEDTIAQFTIDVGDWPVSGDNVVIDASCTVASVGPTIALECEHGETTRPVTLQLSASPALNVPLAVDARVDFSLRRKAAAAPDRGYFRVRGEDGTLVLAGARSYASVPGSDAAFFAPLSVALDLETCDERKTDECRLEQKVVLEFGDGAATTRAPHGSTVTLPSGHQVRVGRAMLSQASGDPKVCPLDETTPETYEYLIAAP